MTHGNWALVFLVSKRRNVAVKQSKDCRDLTNKHIVTDTYRVVTHLTPTDPRWWLESASCGNYGIAVQIISELASIGFRDNLAYRPILIAVVGALLFSPSPEEEKRCKSPSMMTSAMMTVRPPSMMFGLPSILALREILLPVSCQHFVSDAAFTVECCRVKQYGFNVLALGGLSCGGSWTRHLGRVYGIDV